MFPLGVGVGRLICLLDQHLPVLITLERLLLLWLLHLHVSGLILLHHWHLWLLEGGDISSLVVNKAVAVQVALVGEPLAALIALEALLVVNIAMAAQVTLMGEALAAYIAGELLLLLVHKLVDVEVVLVDEAFATHVTLVLPVLFTHVLVVVNIVGHDLLVLRLLPAVGEAVAVEVDLLAEAFAALLTLKLLLL